MSRNIGEVRVSVLPDADRFRPEAIAALKRAAAGLHADIPLDVSRGLRTKMEAAVKAASAGLHGGVDLNVNRGLRTKMESAVKTASTGLSASVDLEADARKLTAELAALRAKGLDLPVDFDVSNAAPALARLRTKMIQAGLSDFLDMSEPIGKIQSQIIILKRLLASGKLSDFLSVNVDADTLRQELDKLTSVTQTIPVELDASAFQKDLAQLGANASDITIGVDTTDAQRAMAALSTATAKATAKATTETDKAAAAQSRAWSTYGKNLLAAEAQEQVLATAAAKIQQDAIDAQNKAWLTYGKNLIAAEAQEQALAAAAAKIQQDAIDSQNKAWLTYGKNVLAAEAQGQAFAAATAKAQQDAIDAQNRAWTTYGKNLLAAEAQEKAFAAAVAAQADAFSTYKVNIDFSEQKALRDAMSLHDKIAATLSGIATTLHLNDQDAEGQALSLRAKLKAILSDITATVKVAYLGGGAGAGGGGSGGGGGGAAAAGAAAGAAGAARGFGILGAAATASLGHISLLHLGVDLLLEAFIAVTAAAGALAVGLYAMAPAAKDVYNHMQAVDTVNESLGNQIPSLSRQFDNLAKSMAPQVIEAYGGALNILSKNTGVFGSVAHQVGNMIDTWVAKLDIWGKSQNSLGGILQSGVGFLSQFGTAIGHLLSAIDNLMKSDPGTAHFLLDLVEGATKLLDWFSRLPKPIVETALALHSLYLYSNVVSGLLAKMPGIIGRVAGAFAGLNIATQVAIVAAILVAVQVAKAWNTASASVAKSIGGMEATLNQMSASQAFVTLPKMIGQLNTELRTDNTTQILKGWTGLNDIWQRTGDKLKVLGSDLKGIVTGSLPSQLKSFASFFGDLFTSNAGQKEAAVQLKQDIADINAEINKMLGSSRNLYGELGSLRKQGYTFSQSLALMDLAGVKWNDTSAVMAQKVDNLINGYKAMSVQGSLLNNAVNAISFATGLQNSKVSQLNSAWDTFIGTITGGQNGFLAFASDVNTMSTNAKAAGASMGGLNAASITLRQSFQTSVTDANSYLDNLTTLAAAADLGKKGTNDLQQATKDLISQMLPAAKNSTVLTTELYALAQRGGYTGADSFQALSKWVGNTKSPMQDLQGITTTFTKAAGNLTKDVQNLSTALGTTLNDAMSQAIFLASGGQKNFDNFAKAVITSKGNISKMQPSANALISELQKMTHNTSDTKAEFISFATAGLGLTKKQADALWKSYAAGTGASNAAAGKAVQLQKAFEDLAGHGGKSGLGLTKAQADNLWSDFGNRGATLIHALAEKDIPKVKSAFEAWAGKGGKSGLGLTKSEADLLWADLQAKGKATADGLTGKVAQMKAAFESLAGKNGKSGLGLTKFQADLVWNDFGSKGTALISAFAQTHIPKIKSAFEAWAGKNGKSGLGLTKAEADILWSDINSKGGAALDNMSKKANSTAGKYDAFSLSVTRASQGVGTGIPKGIKPGTDWLRGPFTTQVSGLFTQAIPSWYDHANNWLSQHYVPDWKAHLNDAAHFLTGTFGPGVSNFFTRTLPHWWTNSVSDFTQQYIDPVKNLLSGSLRWITGSFGPGMARFFTSSMPNFFVRAIDGIGRAWSRFQSIIHNPVHLVAADILAPLFKGIDYVTNFVGLGNPFAGAVTTLSRLATGGQVTGGVPGKDSVLAALMPGEVVVPTHMVRAGAVDHLRGKLPGFAGGGMITVPGMASGGGISLAGYFNPMRNARAVPQRIDQGVDFSGVGPVGAIGAATITETGGGGWPGGPYMAYRLDSGSLAGQYIYLAENIRPTVRVGQNVMAGQTIANMFSGGTGIEMGFAAPGGRSPMSQMAAAGGISGANLPGDSVTAVGQAFDNLLVALGAPRAPNYGQPAAGRIPGGVGNAGTQPNHNPLAAIANFLKSVGSGIVGFVETVAQVFAGLGRFAKVGIDLAGGNLGAAVGDFLGIFHPSAEGAKGEFGTLLTDLPKTLVTDVVKHIASSVAGFANSQIAASAGGGTAYNGPASFGGGFESLSALESYARYFMQNGLNAAAAAGMAATISGEQTSAGPESVGSGGFGLIGWTGNTIGLPAGYHGPTGNVARDLAIQLKGVIGYMNANGGAGPLNAAGNSGGPIAAGNLWSSKYERPAVRYSDTRPGTAVAIYNALKGVPAPGGASAGIPRGLHHAAGGLIPPGGISAATLPVHVFDRGGTLSPGINAVYNLTGKPEHLTPTGSGAQNVNVTLEIQGGDSEIEQFLLQILRKLVRVKGGGNVQTAFGRR